jgi:pyruvate/2-oxoglutarate dehydrogenase complex dihydrolipoamide dehydrogenase (E3) component
MAYDYDIIIIGGGPAGLVASKFARGLGKRVALIEKNKLGGECTWTGCIPSKTLIRVAQVAYSAKNLREYGLACAQDIVLDTTKVMAHIHAVIKHVASSHTADKLEALGIDVFFGSPFFTGNHTIGLNGQVLSAKKFIIATGTSPFIPPVEGLSTVSYLTNQTVFNLKKLPQSMIILGAGPIGIEIANCLNRLGVKITLIEMGSHILPREDSEITRILNDQLIKEGVLIKTEHKAIRATQSGGVINLDCVSSDSKPFQVQADSILVATGRVPNIEGLHLDTVHISTGPKGVIVDDWLRTSVAHIYACGDIVGPYQFSHMAEYQAIIAVRNALIPFFKKKVDYRQAVWVTFTEPEFASAGLNESEARARYGDNIVVYRKKYTDLDRSQTDGNTIGLGKFICDTRGKILGAHILGARAGELIHEVQLGKYYNVKFFNFYPVIHAYPTYSELIWQGSKDAYVDHLQKSFLIRLARFIFGKKQW